MSDTTAQPPAEPADRHAAAKPPMFYQALFSDLDPADQTSVINAIRRHDEEVRVADAAGRRAAESI